MTLVELKAVVDRLVSEGHGEVEVVTTPENYNPGYRMRVFLAGLREAVVMGEGFWIYNLRNEPRVSVFELAHAGFPKS